MHYMDARQIVKYVAYAAGGIILLCAAIAILKALLRCLCGVEKRRRRRTSPTVTVISSHEQRHQPAYTIAGTYHPHPSPYPNYGTTVPSPGPPYPHSGLTYQHSGPAYQHSGPAYSHSGQAYPHSGPAYPHSGPQNAYPGAHHSPGGNFNDGEQGFVAATAPPRYSEAVPSEAYSKQAAFNPAYT